MPLPSIETLPPKQREVLDQIRLFIQDAGYPPSIQQLCKLVGVTSTSTIHYHLTALKKKGFISWNPDEKRALQVHPDLMEVGHRLPIMGSIAAGTPITALSDAVDHLDLTEDIASSGSYVLRVRGTSMIEDHVMDGDLVVINPDARVREGDMVVALIDGHTATLKRFYKEPNGLIRLQPSNSEMEPIFVKDCLIQGKVEAVIRKI